MQLASGFTELAAAGYRHIKVHFHYLFEGKMLIVQYKLDNHILNFRPYIRRYTSRNDKFEYSYPLNNDVLRIILVLMNSRKEMITE